MVNNYRKGDYRPYLFRTGDYGATWTNVVDTDKVKGYALSFIQDPVEPNLQFLGTENGLWVSSDNGVHWQAVENGIPSVSTMDLKIQRRESALIIGTFGRAIWVLDELKSLREIAANRLKPILTALPMNDAVQVKGLYIAPPGNIWNGFGTTTFEGENRVFQRTEIPFYLDELSKPEVTITVDIYNSTGTKINTVSGQFTQPGLQYLIWKLDEQAVTLPGAWITDESRGIPVLPGTYQVVVRAGDASDTTQVTVIADPRFSLPSTIDEKLYTYQQASRLSSLLIGLDQKTERLEKTLRYLQDIEKEDETASQQSIEAMLVTIQKTRACGQTPRPKDRQLGAWQSYDVTAYSTTADAQRKAKARTTVPSTQDWETVDQAKALINVFEQEVDFLCVTLGVLS